MLRCAFNKSINQSCTSVYHKWLVVRFIQLGHELNKLFVCVEYSANPAIIIPAMVIPAYDIHHQLKIWEFPPAEI